MSDIKKIRNNYIFVDFENVQPKSFEFPKDYPFQIIIFVGANQTKIPIELATSMQNLGHNAKYVVISGNGKNALDFHLTFYLGKLYEKDSEGYFHIISKDTGFDPLIKHLREKKTLINRYNDISEIPALKQANCDALTIPQKIDLIVEYLIKRGNAKPRKVETLSNTINSLCARNLNKDQLEDILKAMAKEKLIIIDGTKVIYTLKRTAL